MISDDRLHKKRFCKKKGGLIKTFLIKRGVGARGGGLERFHILRGGFCQKEGIDFFMGEGGSYPGAHYADINPTFHVENQIPNCTSGDFPIIRA